MCQMVFRKTFHQSMPLSGKPLRFQILHVIVQLLLAPLIVVLSLFIKNGIDVSDVHESNRSLYGIRKWNEKDAPWIRKIYNKIIDFAFEKQLKLNVPVNRFIIFTGYYILFVLLLAYIVWDKSMNGYSYCFGPSLMILTIFAISMLWHDFNALWNVRSFFSFFEFWKMYDLSLHIGLLLTLILRGSKAMNIDCPGCDLQSCNDTYHITGNITEEALPIVVRVVDDWEDCFLSLVSI